jgi:hypothetical protein
VPAAGPGEEGLVEDASFAANGLSDRLQQKGAATVILILDACRDNPFAVKGKRAIGMTRGLTRMDPAEGMFVLFSAKLKEGGGESALPPQEQKTQFGYRIGDQGSFTDAGFIDSLDQRTGQRMPKTYFELPPDQGKTKLYITWRDRRGEQADIVTVNFDPQAALAESEKKILEELWTALPRLERRDARLLLAPHHLSLRH